MEVGAGGGMREGRGGQSRELAVAFHDTGWSGCWVKERRRAPLHHVLLTHVQVFSPLPNSGD